MDGWNNTLRASTALDEQEKERGQKEGWNTAKREKAIERLGAVTASHFPYMTALLKASSASEVMQENIYRSLITHVC